MLTGQTIASRYLVKRKIGGGSFGAVFLGEHIVKKTAVAIKIEKCSLASKKLKMEDKIYGILKGCPGIPEVYWYGVEGSLNVLVMELLGKSLEDYIKVYKDGFSLKTVLMIADQMLVSIKHLHDNNYIHRDIKPENFLFDISGEEKKLNIIDFGLANKYRSKKTNEHIPYRAEKELVGTSRYVSISTHLGIEQSRRDDLESLGYVLVYIAKGKLPWQGLVASSQKEKYEKIAHEKMTTSFESLCKGLPNEFVEYFNIVRGLEFTEDPPYEVLRSLFRRVFDRNGYVFDYVYDWTQEKEEPVNLRISARFPTHAPIFGNEEFGTAGISKDVKLPEGVGNPVLLENGLAATLPPIKRKRARNKREWKDPGRRRPFPRGPPPVPAKLYAPNSGKQLHISSRALASTIPPRFSTDSSSDPRRGSYYQSVSNVPGIPYYPLMDGESCAGFIHYDRGMTPGGNDYDYEFHIDRAAYPSRSKRVGWKGSKVRQRVAR